MQRTLWIVVAAALCLETGPCAQSGQTLDYWPAQDWKTIPAAEAGFAAPKLAAAAEFARSHGTTSLLVVRRGRIVLEHYGEGGGRDVQHVIASSTKSMVAILVGMALDANKLAGLDQSVSTYVADWKDTPKAAITLRHLLSMTTGLDPRGFAARRATGDQFERNKTMPLAAKPGTRWRYNTPAYRMLFRILEKATGESLAQWTQRKLLTPLGMKHTAWRTEVRGGKTNYLNLRCSARDMARFGLFVRRGGVWNGKPLVSAEFFKQATTPSQALNPAYGLLFWLNAEQGRTARRQSSAFRFPGAPRDLIACIGARGQTIVVVPSKDLVIVRQGHAPGKPQFTAELARMVLAAIIGDGAAEAPVVRWLRPRAVPIRSSAPDADDADLQILDKAVGKARVVLLGEEVHGVREFLQVKHRIIRYLVEHHAFDTIAFEQDTLACAEIDRYLASGDGDPARTLRSVYWCWNNREVLELIRWLRKHNESSKREVRLVGIDNQSVGRAGRLLRSLVGSDAGASHLAPALDPFKDGRGAYQKLQARRKKQHRQAIAELRADLARRSAPGSQKALGAVEILEEVRELWAAPNVRVRMNARDRHMATRTKRLLEREDARVLVWAHNAHVSRALFYGGVVPLGKHISEHVPSVVVGLYFGHGETLLDPRARAGAATRTIVAPKAGSLAATLSRVAEGTWIADLRADPLPEDVASFLAKPPAGHFDNYATPPSLVGAIDLLLFVKRVTPPSK